MSRARLITETGCSAFIEASLAREMLRCGEAIPATWQPFVIISTRRLNTPEFHEEYRFLKGRIVPKASKGKLNDPPYYQFSSEGELIERTAREFDDEAKELPRTSGTPQRCRPPRKAMEISAEEGEFQEHKRRYHLREEEDAQRSAKLRRRASSMRLSS